MCTLNRLTIDDFHKTGYEFLSNFYPVEIEYTQDGDNTVVYPSVEHAYQAQKSYNVDEQLHIASLAAGQAKRYACKELRCPKGGFHVGKVRLMHTLLRLKFQDERLASMLLATSDAKLVGGNNWHDNFWGHCYCSDCVDKHHLNKLGIILMRVRGELRGIYSEEEI